MDGHPMDLGAFRSALLAALDRIATALERANANDPIGAINRALETMHEGEGAGAPPPAVVPPEELWRLR